MANHSFNEKIAGQVGIAAAVIYKNILYWTEKNVDEGRNIHDGYVWTFNSVKSWTTFFPYMTPSQIRTALAKLVAAGLVSEGCYNKTPYDRTKWYGVPLETHRPDRAIELEISDASNCEISQTIPNGKPDCNTDSKPDSPSQNDDLFGERESSSFAKPSETHKNETQNPDYPKKQTGNSAAADAERVREVWNAMAKRNDLPTVTKITSARLSQLTARIKEAGGVEPLCRLIDGMESSDFLMGRANANGRKWWVSFDFFIRESTHVKIAEGAYGNAPLGAVDPSGRPTGETKEQMAARQKAMREQALADGTIF